MLDITASFCEIQASELKKILLKKANLSQMSMYLMETIATTTHLISVNDLITVLVCNKYNDIQLTYRINICHLTFVLVDENPIIHNLSLQRNHISKWSGT